MEPRPARRLLRSRRERMFAGVCGGLAEYFEIDVVIWRLAFVVGAFLSGGALFLVYLAAAVLMPRDEGGPGLIGQEPIAPASEPLSASMTSAGDPISYLLNEATQAPSESRGRNGQTAGIIMVGLGMLLLLSNLNVLAWAHWERLWPVLFIVLGAAILIGQRRR